MARKLASLILTALMIGGTAFGAGFNTKTVKTPDGPYEISWRVDKDLLHVRLKMKCPGWLGVGFTSRNDMQGATLVMGKINDDGKALIGSFFSPTGTDPVPVKRLGGTSHLTNKEGNKENGVTTLSFTLPLTPHDATSHDITPEKTTLLASYGPDGSFQKKHAFAAHFTVNLLTGEDLGGK